MMEDRKLEGYTGNLNKNCVTIAEALKPAGYATAMFGMWNLGRGRDGPETATGQGFDRYISTKTLGFDKDAYRDGDRYLTDAFTDEMIEFIDASKDQPFFIYFAPHATHHPYDPKPELLERYRSKPKDGPMSAEYAATIEALDTNLGRLMDELERRGIADDTLFIFTADNGGMDTDEMFRRACSVTGEWSFLEPASCL